MGTHHTVVVDTWPLLWYAPGLLNRLVLGYLTLDFRLTLPVNAVAQLFYALVDFLLFAAVDTWP